MAVPQPDWTKADLDLVREAVNGGDARLAAQVQLAISADQRATVLAGIYAAIATGIITAMIAHGSFEGEDAQLIGGGVATLAYMVGAVLCVLATLPVSFWAPGNDPEAWFGDIASSKKLVVALGEQAVHQNKHIMANNRAIARNAKFFKSGALLGIAAPAIGGIAAAAFGTCWN